MEMHPLFKTIQLFGKTFDVIADIPDDLTARFLSKIDFESNTSTGCWRWDGCKKTLGYGVFYFGKKYASAHKAAWSIFRGPIDEGLHLHHQTEAPINCMGPSCVNPEHLLPVTPSEHARDYTPENITNQNRERTHCSRGHELSGDNVYYFPGRPHRRCMACHREWQNARKPLRSGQKRIERTHCRNGHELSGDNVYEYLGQKQCRACHNANCITYYEKHLSPRANPRPPKPARTECKHGHPWIPENLVTQNCRGKQTLVCLLCRKEAGRRSYQTLKEKLGKQ